MTPMEIIQNDPEIQATGQMQEFTEGLAKLISAKQVTMLRHMDILCILINAGKNKAQIMIVGQADTKTLLTAVRDFLQKIRNSGINTIYGFTDSPEDLKLFKAVGLNAQKSDNQRFDWMARI